MAAENRKGPDRKVGIEEEAEIRIVERRLRIGNGSGVEL